jgi:hypothetical protein
MEPLSYILGGTLFSFVTLSIGKIWGSNGRVKDATCGERRISCNKLIDERLHSMDEKLDIILKRLD